MNINKELFKIFQESKDNYELYEKTIMFTDKIIKHTKGQENSRFYDLLILLENSINNAGWENRRSEQIKTICNALTEISSKYEEYLQ